MSARITADLGPGRPWLEFELQSDEVTFGRDPACTVHLEDAGMSRLHARVMKSARGYVVMDENSANGVLLNGIKTSHALLANGDKFQLGHTVFTYSEGRSLAETQILDNATAVVSPPGLALAAEPPAEPTHPPLRLRVTSSPNPDAVGTEIVIKEDEAAFGRDPRNNIVVPDKKASRVHAKIVWEDDAVFLIDNQSGNGTFLNGERVERARLGELDVFIVGETRFLVTGGPPIGSHPPASERPAFASPPSSLMDPRPQQAEPERRPSPVPSPPVVEKQGERPKSQAPVLPPLSSEVPPTEMSRSLAPFHPTPSPLVPPMEMPRSPAPVPPAPVLPVPSPLPKPLEKPGLVPLAAPPPPPMPSQAPPPMPVAVPAKAAQPAGGSPRSFFGSLFPGRNKARPCPACKMRPERGDVYCGGCGAKLG